MKALNNEEKIRFMNNIIEPFVNNLSPDVVAGCIASMLKSYLNSADADNAEIRANVIYSTGIAVKLFDYLMSWYED